MPSAGRVSVVAVVSSPRTADGESFFAQDRGGGPGLRVALRGDLPSLPPPVGVEVSIDGDLVQDGVGPVVWVDDVEAVAPTGRVVEPVVAWWPEAPLRGLVRAEVTVMSPPDPIDEALTEQFALDGMFRVPPPRWRATAAVEGVVVEAGRVAPRSAADWHVSSDGLPPVEATIGDLGALAEGSWVALALTQASPWSLDGRFVLLQDSVGAGVWVDTEGFAVRRATAVGDDVRVVAELRSGALRCWTDFDVVGASSVVSVTDPTSGAVVAATLTPTGTPDRWGAWPTLEGPRVGERFRRLTAELPVSGWFAVAEDRDGPVLHPY